jgi:hypothetical protein
MSVRTLAEGEQAPSGYLHHSGKVAGEKRLAKPYQKVSEFDSDTHPPQVSKSHLHLTASSLFLFIGFFHGRQLTQGGSHSITTSTMSASGG